MDKRVIEPFVTSTFEKDIVPALMNFIRIPNCSPSYDKDWQTNGFQEQAALYIKEWVESQNMQNTYVHILQEKNRTPFIYIEIEASKKNDSRSILMYGHFDKQPPLEGWSEGLGPRTPIIKENHLYGRGGADDGYGVFAAVTAVKCAQANNWPLPRINIIIEGAEESYTNDLEFYVDFLSDEIGKPSLIICLDSGCEDYKRLWVTSSLRGVISLDLKVSLLTQGIHSGIGGGLVAESFMILRNLIDRIEDPLTAKMLIEDLFVQIPENRRTEIKEVVKIIGQDIIKNVPFEAGVKPLSEDIEELIVNNTWKPYLCVIGADGFPVASRAGNVLRPYTQVKLSIRVPPMIDSVKAGQKVVEVLTNNPPYNAIVEVKVENTGDGWNLQNFSERLRNITNTASQRFYNENQIKFLGEGGSIPFVQILNNKFKNSDFLVLGVSGPGCNIHGLDENLDLDFCRRLICCLSYILSDY